MPYRRSQRLVRPGLQLRFGLAAAAIALSSVAVMFLLLRWSFAEVLEPSLEGGLLVTRPGRFLLLHALASAALVVPFALVVGALALFPIVGPLHRMEQHLRRFLAGDDPGPCLLRKGDRLTELNALLNRVLERARAAGDPERAPGEGAALEPDPALPRESADERSLDEAAR